MPGIRIHHTSLTNAMLAVPSKRMLGEPKYCMKCDETHIVKHYHFDLDSDGNAIVSETVWERVKEIGTHSFVVLNEVANPPTVHVAFQRTPQHDSRRFVKEINGALHDLTPPGMRATITRGRSNG